MIANPLHITNGTSLTEYLEQLDISNSNNTITWQETLCVGPTVEN